MGVQRVSISSPAGAHPISEVSISGTKQLLVHITEPAQERTLKAIHGLIVCSFIRVLRERTGLVREQQSMEMLAGGYLAGAKTFPLQIVE